MEYTIAIPTREDFSSCKGTVKFLPVKDMPKESTISYLKKNPNDWFMLNYLITTYPEDANKILISICNGNDYFPLREIQRTNEKENAINRLNTSLKESLNDLTDKSKRDRCFSILESYAEDELYKKYTSIDKVKYQRSNKKDYDLETSLREVPVNNTGKCVINESFLEKMSILRIETINPMGTWGASVVRKTDQSNIDSSIRISGYMSQGGKGISESHAIVSALMETVERISAEMHGDEGWPYTSYYQDDLDLRENTLKELISQGINALNPNLCDNCLLCEYREEDKIPWVRGKTFNGEDKYVPAEMVFFPLNLNSISFYNQSTNGLSSGNTLNDAKLQSLLELIERDGIYSIFPSPDRIFSIESSSDNLIKSILKEYKKTNLNLRFLDLTSELGVPTFEAFFEENGVKVTGYGADLDSRRAIKRAIGELNNRVPWFLSSSNRNDANAKDDKYVPIRKFEELPDYSSGCVETDLSRIEDLFNTNGYEPVYVDLTTKKLGIPVVRSIVPGLSNVDGNKKYYASLYKKLREKYPE